MASSSNTAIVKEFTTLLTSSPPATWAGDTEFASPNTAKILQPVFSVDLIRNANSYVESLVCASHRFRQLIRSDNSYMASTTSTAQRIATLSHTSITHVEEITSNSNVYTLKVRNSNSNLAEITSIANSIKNLIRSADSSMEVVISYASSRSILNRNSVAHVEEIDALSDRGLFTFVSDMYPGDMLIQVQPKKKAHILIIS